jgi:drug/metabolite transporter (DMT)-like permease
MLLVSTNITIIRSVSNVHHSITNLVAYVWGMLQALILSLAFGYFKLPTLEEAIVFSSSGVGLSLAMACLVLALQNEKAGVVALIRTSEVLFVFVWQLIVVGTLPDMYR